MRAPPLVLVALALAAPGCGPSRPRAEIDRGRQAVTAALDNWKNDEPADQLKVLPDPVAFTEELRKTHRLTGYTLAETDAADPKVIRYRVTLTMQDRKGKASEREVVYAVELKTPVTVGRDPYY